jgi:hypothetical protein
VARPGDVTASGLPVFYSGSKLAADLSLPWLLRAWDEAAQGSEAAVPVEAARRRVEAARSAVGAARRNPGVASADGIAHVTRDVLTAVGGWSDELRAAAQVYDRAARPPRGMSMRPDASAAGLRRVARQLTRQRWLLGVSDEPGAAAVALLMALSALLREIAAWQRERDRPHQAAATISAAGNVERWVAGQVAAPLEGSGQGSAVRRPQLDRVVRRGAGPPRD